MGYYAGWTDEQRLLHRARVFRTRYGISLEMLAAMYEAQEGCCAICGNAGEAPAKAEKGRRDETLHVDHDHESKHVRGLLCNRCNLGLGFFGDNVDALIRAAAYLVDRRR